METVDISLASRILLKQCLNTTHSDQVLIIYDECFLPFLKSFLDVISNITTLVTFIYFPLQIQKNIARQCTQTDDLCDVDLPVGLVNSIHEATILISFLTGGSTTSIVRREIINQQRLKNCKFVHIPDVTNDVFECLINSHIDEIYKHSEMFAWALGEGRRARVITSDSRGKYYELGFNLGDWNIEPFMSPGIFFPGTWGNIPPGETFFCPDPHTVTGQICINGSLPGYVLSDNDEVILKFAKGRLVEWTAKPGSKSDIYFNELIRKATSINDENWNNFAEFGIGLNRFIKKLTGLPVFDEKAYSTVHIALGDNECFGFNVKSYFHEDLITKNPTFYIDQYKVIEQGEYNISVINNWRNSIHDEVYVLRNEMELNIDKSKVTIWRDKVMRKLSNGSRISYIDIIPKNQMDLAINLFNILKESKYISFYELKDNYKEKYNALPISEICILINILKHYKVLDIG